MNYFLIKLLNNEISLYYKSRGEFEIIRYKGEEYQQFNKSSFWSWWRNKVEYDQREVSFVVITDRDEFIIPSDIILSEENLFLKYNSIKDIEYLVEGNKLMLFPISNVSQQSQILSDGLIADYYRKKTDEYQN